MPKCVFSFCDVNYTPTKFICSNIFYKTNTFLIYSIIQWNYARSKKLQGLSHGIHRVNQRTFVARTSGVRLEGRRGLCLQLSALYSHPLRGAWACSGLNIRACGMLCVVCCKQTSHWNSSANLLIDVNRQKTLQLNFEQLSAGIF